MKKTILLQAVLLLFVSCGNSHKPLEREIAAAAIETPQPALLSIEAIVADITYPQINQMEFNGELIADLSLSTQLVSSFGTVTKGTTLNLITLQGIVFLVFGEDGVFATECEPSAMYPDHGATHPNCEIAHAESYDKIILCTSAAAGIDLMTAQNWPGSQASMEDATLGMLCWVNGVKMKSKKIFTY